MSVISFMCTECFRQYRVAEAMAGRRVKCKDCGAELRVPGGTGAGGAAADDPYGLADLPKAQRSRFAEEDEDDAPPPPRRTASPARERPKRKPARWATDADGSTAAYAGTGMLVLGFGLLYALASNPQILLTIGLHSIVAVVVLGLVVLGGALLVLGATAYAAVRFASTREMPSAGPVGMVAWVLGLLVSIPVSYGAWNGFWGAWNGRQPPNPLARPVAAPNFPAPHFPAPHFPAPPAPDFGPPPGDAQVTLTGGRVRPRTTPFGTQVGGLEVAVDYQMTGSPGVGERFNLIIKSGKGTGALAAFHLDPSGTLGGENLHGSIGDGPFEAWMEAEGLGGRGSRKVSNTIPLQVEQGPPPRDAFDGFPEPPGLPRPPGFPGMPGGPPRFPNRP